MSDIRMIALDLDRTTLKDHRTMTDVTIDALERAGKLGVEIVIATGRVFDALPDVVHGLSCVKYFICSNGATVFDAKTHEIIYEKCLEPQAVETMVDYVKERGYMFESFTEGFAYIGRDYYDKVAAGKLLYRSREYVTDTRTPVDDIFSFTLDHKNRIENMNVFFPTPEEKENAREYLAAIPNSVLTSSFPSNLELEGEGVGKGAALSFVMEKDIISPDELLAAGDSPNDLSMLELAGIPVAVANAEQAVKDAASYIAPSNVDDGVADAISKFVL